MVRSGALKPSELPSLKLAMFNHAKVGDIARLPKNQRSVLTRYYTHVSNAALATNPSFNAVRRNINAGFEINRDDVISEAITKDPPMVLVLKRKGIRIFPDGRRVALYTNDQLGTTFSVPYTPNEPQQPVPGIAEGVEVIVENINVIKSVAEHGEPQVIKFENGSQMKVHPEVAKHIMVVHDALNDKNKKVVADMVKRSPDHLNKVLDFAKKNTSYTINPTKPAKK
jgi:hypothetical protein